MVENVHAEHRQILSLTVVQPTSGVILYNVKCCVD